MKWFIWLIIVFVLFIIILVRGRIKRRGYFWRDRRGEELSGKEFVSRWKKGYTEITPLQQTRISLWSFLPIISGILLGIVISIFWGVDKWWVTLILFGSLPLTLIQFYALVKKFEIQRQVERTMKELEKQSNNIKIEK